MKAKALTHHYCVFANQHTGSGSSGLAEVVGNDFMVTLGGPGWVPPGGTAQEQEATFMHEFGHNLGLFHGGNQADENRFNFKPNYHSVMNYSWQFPEGSPARQASWIFDYSRKAFPDLDENALNENAGITGHATDVVVSGPRPTKNVVESGRVDWD